MRFGHLGEILLRSRGTISLIRFYQKWLSGLWRARCIYTPTCSEYGIQAITRFGLLRGCVILFFRVIRCVPRFYLGGNDPMIEHFSIRALLRKLKPNATRRAHDK